MMEQVGQEPAGYAGKAAAGGPHGDDDAHLQRAQPQVGGDERGEQRDGVGEEVLEGVGADEGGGHHAVAGATAFAQRSVWRRLWRSGCVGHLGIARHRHRGGFETRPCEVGGAA